MLYLKYAHNRDCPLRELSIVGVPRVVGILDDLVQLPGTIVRVCSGQLGRLGSGEGL